MSVPGSNVTVAAWPLRHTLPAPPSSLAWKYLAVVCTVISPTAPCFISTDAIVPPVNCTLKTFHSPSSTPSTELLPAKT